MKKYRVRNWSHYNQSLVQRGSITFWFDQESLAQWQNTQVTGKRGRPQKYNDIAIHCGLTLKAIFRLTFRSTEGFISSLVKMLKLNIDTPNYSLLCKRQKSLPLNLPKKPLKEGEKINIVVDTTGLKVYGEGEWKVRQHGWMKHRLWRKLHLAVNSESQEIEACELTDLGVQDCEGLYLLMNNIGDCVESCKGDGAYDRYGCYEESIKRDFKLVTPPQRNAVTSDERRASKKKASVEAVKKRDEMVIQMRELGRKEWKIQNEYHRRSLAETAMFRMKTLLGNKLSTRKLENQKLEVAIRCQIINKMTLLGMQASIKVA